MMAEQTKKCPKCAELVLADAKVCKHCSHKFGVSVGRILAYVIVTLCIVFIFYACLSTQIF